ncbi:hypothetical_protein [Leishmania braziliensis MHOM/BR/75/M2904]|uniref:Hypothetical_protein n=1 Tax=Leishmania braziliensis MHOM/BR/75/M2904 TaxID=420245 RepID=A0A3P3YWN4_LEIBR|nr:unnamed protein product [Leishmania braziliensis]SYZ62347.1 hypothetical_protein [Leishmania braziliensis MHOM/BR/75/M2904]
MAVLNFGRDLRALGIPQVCKIGMPLETRWEWLASAYGVWSQCMVLATVNANLGEAFVQRSCAVIMTVGERVLSLIAMIERGSMPYCILTYLDALPGGHPCDGRGRTL